MIVASQRPMLSTSSTRDTRKCTHVQPEKISQPQCGNSRTGPPQMWPASFKSKGNHSELVNMGNTGLVRQLIEGVKIEEVD